MPVRESTISLTELQRMHGIIKKICRNSARGPGTQEFSLMSQIGWHLGKYPVMKEKFEDEIVSRYHDILIHLFDRCERITPQNSNASSAAPRDPLSHPGTAHQTGKVEPSSAESNA